MMYIPNKIGKMSESHIMHWKACGVSVKGRSIWDITKTNIIVTHGTESLWLKRKKKRLGLGSLKAKT